MEKKIIFLFLLLNSFLIHASKVDTLKVYSKSMNKMIKNIVIVPDTKGDEKEFLPVVYLLHGHTDKSDTWFKIVPEIKDYADKYNLIIVCADGGYSSWYLDSPINKKIQYETYISKELIKVVDTKYNTLKKRSGRAITGLSMGGHGAFYLSFRHQDIWGSAGSISGGLDISRFYPEGGESRWNLIEALGDQKEFPEYWEKNSVINMLDLLKQDSLKLIFDCGIDDFFFDANLELHEKLVERKIPHDFIERPGGHNWNYFSNSLEYHFLFFQKFFNQVKS